MTGLKGDDKILKSIKLTYSQHVTKSLGLTFLTTDLFFDFRRIITITN